MRGLRKTRNLCISLAALVLSLVAITDPTSAATITPATAWGPIAVSGPTHLPPGSNGIGRLAIYVQNVGGKTSFGTITVKDKLPSGLTTAATPTSEGNAWTCSPGAGQSTITCTNSEAVEPGLASKSIIVPLAVTATEGTVENEVEAEGAGATPPPAVFKTPIEISATPAKPGVQTFTAASYNADGSANTQASSHPYASSTAIFANTILGPNGKAIVPAGDPKTFEVALPPGFIGNPTATPRCIEGLKDDECSITMQVGVVQPVIGNFGENEPPNAVHGVEAPIGYPAKFTFSLLGSIFQINALASLRSDEDYGVTITSPNTAQVFPVFGVFFSFWGTPADPSHENLRCVVPGEHGGCGPGAEEKAFVTQAADCALQAVQPPIVKLTFDTWLTIGEFNTTEAPISAVVGCNELSMGEAKFALRPDTQAPASPAAFTAELTLPQDGLTDPDPEALAPPPLKRSEISFAPGVTLNPSAADGLATCSTEQIGYKGNDFPAPNRIRFDKSANRCPDAAKVGSLEVKTPLLDNPLHGSLYLAAQGDNPFGSLLAVYLVIEDPRVGIIIKLPGQMRSDPVSGQLSVVFDDGPQTPFESLKLNIRGGPRSPLATPDTCGEVTTRGALTPWSAPESGPPTPTTDSFVVSAGPGVPCPSTKAERPFAPTLAAGTASKAPGAYSPLELTVSRKDGEQELKGISITLPPGLTGKLAGIGTCDAAAITAAATKSGKAEQAAPSCPASSRLGTLDTAAGIGGAPLHVGGKLYLAGPYKGAPLSVVAIIPAVAGPYDLGNVLNRSAAYIDPESARLSAVSDLIPDNLQGIPLAIRSVKVNLDRPGFTLTPTSCDPMVISAKLTGAGAETISSADDTSATATAPYQVTGCKKLRFKPSFDAKLRGGTGRNAHPAFRASLSYPKGSGYANIRYAQVALPHSEFLDQGHIVTVCTRPQFAAKACPKGSIYGHAKASTPLLDEPLKGPVYLRSSDNKLPDLAVALRGPESRPIEVVLDGRIDSIHGGIRTTFDKAPDAPVSKFVLTMKGGSKGLLVNSRNLCKTESKARMTVRLIAHNNKRADQFPVLRDDCGKGKKHK